MKPQDFTDATRISCVRQPEGYWAFIPPVLPPSLELDWKLASLMSEADRAMAELSGAGRLLPNPHLLIRPYLRREAVLSSMIEDTIAEVDELLLFEVEPETEPPRADIREVANHVTALETGIRKLEELPISSRLICELHRILLQSVRGGHSNKTPGEYRRSQNWIGRPGCNLNEATYVPPPPEELSRLLSDLENFIHGDTDEPDLVKCALLHYQFEAIHPFLDGNGRIGRLLVTLFLCSRGALSQPLLYLSGFFEEHRDEYYRRLLAVSLEGDWLGWLFYFLTGVREQARAALNDTKAILALYEMRRREMNEAKRVPSAAAGILDALFASPMISIPRHCEMTGQSFHVVSKGIDFWEGRGLLREITGNQRNRIFVAGEILQLMAPKKSK
ncbi:MAG: Fic family protein [Verrucomicrobiae bacterium]|nr:Fic family protein [Verrucomicrobiae bacterium]